MTLAELLSAAQQLSVPEKPLEPFKTYDLPTPYDNFGTGAILMEALKHSKLKQS